MEVGREDELNQLRRLVGYSRALYSGVDLDGLVRLALDEAIVVLPMDRMTIALRDTPGSPLRLVGVRDGTRVTTRGELTSPFTAVEVQTINQGAPVFIDDAASKSRRLDEVVARSVMAAPLKSTGKRAEMFGVLVVASRAANVYDEGAKRVFREVAAVTAAALSITIDMARQRQAGAQDAMLNAIFAKLQGVTDVDTLVSLFTQEMGRAFGADTARSLLIPNESTRP